MKTTKHHLPLQLPPIPELRGLEEECRALLKEEQRIRHKRIVLEKYLTAARAAAKEGLVFKVSAEAKPPAPRTRVRVRAAKRVAPLGSWPEGVLNVINSAGRGVTPGEAKRIAAGTEALADRLKRSDKGFYGAIGKLIKRKKIVRHNGHLFSLQAYSEFQKGLAAGLVPDVRVPHVGAHTSPMKDALMNYLKAQKSGATFGQILAELEKDPHLAEAIKRSRNSFYNLVARLVKRGELTRKGPAVRYVQQNEAPKISGAPNGSLGGESGSSPSFGLAAASGATDGD